MEYASRLDWGLSGKKEYLTHTACHEGMNPATPAPSTDLASLARQTAREVAWLTAGMMALSLALQVILGA